MPSRPRRATVGRMDQADADVLGSVPDGVVEWKIKRLDEGSDNQGVNMRWPDERNIVHAAWPLAQFSLESVRSRWGAGRYRVWWLRRNENGALIPAGMSKVFEFHGEDVVAGAEETHAAADPLETALRMQRNAEERVFGLVERVLARQAPASQGFAPAPAVETPELARLRRENEELRQAAALRAETDRLEARFRAERDEADRRLRELEQRLAERDRDEDREPLFNPDEPWYASVARAIANKVVDNPAQFLEIPFVQNTIDRYMKLQEAKAGLVAAPPPLPAAAPSPANANAQRPAPTPTPNGAPPTPIKFQRVDAMQEPPDAPPDVG